MVEKRCSVQREGVYRWFSQLNSAQRAEFLCGLLDLCVPIELRFLGSCLEDLARKDYHSLRDAEIKANNPADLANLTNITDEVVRSKLLISLALLNSDNRQAAGVLFRTLTHIDSIINNYGLQLNDGQTGDQFLLLFTMASNHPAFSFHQKQVLRQELTQIQGILQTTCSEHHTGGTSGVLATLTAASTVATYITTAAALSTCHVGCPCSHKVQQREERARPGEDGSGLDCTIQASTQSNAELLMKVPSGQSNKVNIERVELKNVPQKTEKPTEYLFEVLWSDSAVSVVSRTPQEVVELLSKVRQLFPDDEKFPSQSPDLDSGLLPDPRCLMKLPQHILRHDSVRQFFCPTIVAPFPASANFCCPLQHRGVSSLPRSVCGVASIQSVMTGQCSLQAVPFPPPGAVTVLPPGGGAALGECVTPLNPAPNHSPQPQPQPGSEQNGILDWLRKLRLHKYYPVFKQLTMEKFLALTEEDLNKYDLTQGAKKKLKTQLELQNREKEKSEKRYVVSQFPMPCSGVARVNPSNHVSPLASLQTTSNTELRVEVETNSHPFARDSSSSSGYSSSPSSPMAPRDQSYERAKDTRRRVDPGSDQGERDRPGTFPSHIVTTGLSRPTAQVLPVQNDPSTSPNSYHLALPPPALSLRPSGRVVASPRKPRPPPILSPLCSDEHAKPLCSGMGIGVQLESCFPGLSLEMHLPLPQDGSGSAPSSGPASSTASASSCGPSSGPPGPLGVLRSSSSLVVETSTALTATSNTLHQVSGPLLQPQLSPSVPPVSPHRMGHFSSSAAWPGFPPVSSVPVTTVADNAYCVKSGSVAPPLSSLNVIAVHGNPAQLGSSPVSTETGSGGPGSQQSVCVCSSCGCSGNCGSYSALSANYAGYFQHPFSGPSVFTLGPLLHLSPLLAGPHPPQHSGTASSFSYPLVAPPLYSSSLPHETQPGLVLPPMQGFLGAGAGVYQPQGMMGNGGVEHKKVGNVSCYNCGLSGHWAQDCRQPPMDAAQQGNFRLKYAPPSESQDSGD